jgi:hypothetical protein
MARFDLKKAIIKFKDGGAEEVTVKVGEGNVSWSEKKNREYILDRGIIDQVRDGDQEPMEISLDIEWDFIKSSVSEPPTLYEILKNSGNASNWVTSGSDPCAPFAVDIEITYTPNCTGVETETILLPEYRYESLDFDANAGTISTSGMCNVQSVTATRSA